MRRNARSLGGFCGSPQSPAEVGTDCMPQMIVHKFAAGENGIDSLTDEPSHIATASISIQLKKFESMHA